MSGVDMRDADQIGWMLVVGISSIEPPYPSATEHVAMRFGKPRQNPWTGMGLLRDMVARWEGE